MARAAVQENQTLNQRLLKCLERFMDASKHYPGHNKIIEASDGMIKTTLGAYEHFKGETENLHYQYAHGIRQEYDSLVSLEQSHGFADPATVVRQLQKFGDKCLESTTAVASHCGNCKATKAKVGDYFDDMNHSLGKVDHYRFKRQN